MSRPIRYLTLGFCLGLIPILFGCGGLLAPQPSVQVSPSSVELGASETTQFSVIVTNSASTAVNWVLGGCAGDACGTISPSGLYTAPSVIPSRVAVTVTAVLQTDSNIGGAAAIYHNPLTLTVSPGQPLYVGARATQVFTASVTRHPNLNVDWSLSGTDCTGEGCGTLTNVTNTSVTYNAPAAVSNKAMVMVKATSSADSTKSKSVPVNLMPVTVTVAPGPLAMAAPSGTRNFRATVEYDTENAGVTWVLSGAGCSGNSCGSLTGVTSTSVVYNAPATPPDPQTVTLTASSITNNAKTGVSKITVSSAPSAFQGSYAFLIQGFRRESGEVTMETMAGHFNADGSGGVAGVWDANRGPIPQQAEPITGSYGMQPDGRGNLTIEAGTELLTFSMTIDETGATARLAEDSRSEDFAIQPIDWQFLPDIRGSSGILVRQDSASFALSSVAGGRVIALSGDYNTSRVAAVGRFSSGPDGTLSEGVADLTWPYIDFSKFTNMTQLTGSFTAPSTSTGRGTAALTTGEGIFNFAYYIVSDRRILLVQTDARGSTMPTLSGEVRRQNGAGGFSQASLNAPIVFYLSGVGALGDLAWPDPYTAVITGRIVPDGVGSFARTTDQNEAGNVVLTKTSSGNFHVEANGRTSLDGAVWYLTDVNSGYLISRGELGPHFGSFEPQTTGSFSLQSMSGTFRYNSDLPASVDSLNASGLLVLAEDGTAVATLSGAIDGFNGKLVLSSSGRGTLTFATSSGTTPAHIVIWAISPARAVALVRSDSDYLRPTLMHLERLK